MKNRDLIAVLSALPSDADVVFAYEDGVRGNVEGAWLTREGRVVLSYRGIRIWEGANMPGDTATQHETPFCQPLGESPNEFDE